MSDHHHKIEIMLHPGTCQDQAVKGARIEAVARSFAALLGQELLPSMRPPVVCYELATLVAYRVIDQAAAEELLDGAQAVRQAGHQCHWCWLHRAVAASALARPRRYLIDTVARPYQRPNV